MPSFAVKLTEPVFTGSLSVCFPLQPPCHTHIHLYTHMPMHAHTHIPHVHTPHAHSHLCTCIRTYIMHTHTPHAHALCTHIHTHAHTPMHTMYTHTLTTNVKYFFSSHPLLLPTGSVPLCQRVSFSQIWNTFIPTHVSPLQPTLPHKASFKAQLKNPLPQEVSGGPSTSRQATLSAQHGPVITSAQAPLLVSKQAPWFDWTKC